MPPLINFEVSTLISLFSLPLGLWADWAYRILPEIPAIPEDNARTSAITIERRYHSPLPAQSQQSSQPPLPPLTVIIPARDEAHNLSTLLPSLKASFYPGPLEILLVDDHSTDQTASVARQYGVQVFQLEDGLPPGWLGKPHACHQGALSASADWLLFTDADTCYHPDALRQLVRHAIDHRLDCLSAFLRQESVGIIDRISLSAAYGGLFAGLSASRCPLNGQLILIRCEAYFQSGGFSSVRGEALEDLSFGRLLVDSGFAVQVVRLEQLVSVRMYRSRSQAFHGLARLGSGSLTWMGFTGILTAVYIAALVSPLFVLAGLLINQAPWHWLVLAWGAVALSQLPWAQRFSPTGFTQPNRSQKPEIAGLALLAPLGGLIVLVAALWGLFSRLFGSGLSWKGRKV